MENHACPVADHSDSSKHACPVDEEQGGIWVLSDEVRKPEAAPQAPAETPTAEVSPAHRPDHSGGDPRPSSLVNECISVDSPAPAPAAPPFCTKQNLFRNIQPFVMTDQEDVALLLEMNESPDHLPMTFIGQHSLVISVSCFVCYLWLQIIFSYATPACAVTYTYAPWTRDVAVGVMALYGLVTLIYAACIGYYYHALDKAPNYQHNERVYLIGILNCSMATTVVAGAATGLFLWNPSAVCVDGLNVVTPNSQWAEWIVLIPMLIFMTLSAERRMTHWRWADSVHVVSHELCIVLGFAMVFVKNVVITWALFAVSCVFMVTHMVLRRCNLRLSVRHFRINQWEEDNGSRSRFAWTLFVSFPVFPVLYVFAGTGIINAHQLMAANMITGLLTKFVFIGVLTSEMFFIQLANERHYVRQRNAKLEYLFRSVSVPLQILIMTMDTISRMKWSSSGRSAEVSCERKDQDHLPKPRPEWENDNVPASPLPLVVSHVHLSVLNNSLKTINQVTENMHDALQYIQDLRKIDYHGVGMKIGVMDLPHVLENALNLVNSRVSSRDVYFKTHGLLSLLLEHTDSPAHYHILGDQVYMYYVLMYLLTRVALSVVKNSEVSVGFQIKSQSTKMVKFNTASFAQEGPALDHQPRIHVSILFNVRNQVGDGLGKFTFLNDDAFCETFKNVTHDFYQFYFAANDTVCNVSTDTMNALYEQQSLQKWFSGSYGQKTEWLMVEKILMLHGAQMTVKMDRYHWYEMEMTFPSSPPDPGPRNPGHKIEF